MTVAATKSILKFNTVNDTNFKSDAIQFVIWCWESEKSETLRAEMHPNATFGLNPFSPRAYCFDSAESALEIATVLYREYAVETVKVLESRPGSDSLIDLYTIDSPESLRNAFLGMALHYRDFELGIAPL